MTFAGTNYFAILIAAVVAWLAGAAWYMSLGKIWASALGITPAEMEARRKEPGAFLPFIYVFVAVDVKAVEPLPKPVTLADIKAEPRLKEMALVKYSRLSVQPVTAAEWKIVCHMAGKKG